MAQSTVDSLISVRCRGWGATRSSHARIAQPNVRATAARREGVGVEGVWGDGGASEQLVRGRIWN